MPGGYVFGDVNARLSNDTYPDSGMLFVDDFSDGFDGWTELYESATNVSRPALSRVTFPAMSGGYALRIGTGAVVNSANAGVGVAIKRLTRIKDTGVVNFDLWWSFGSTDWPNAPQNIEFGIDTQKRDGSVRTFGKWRWQIVNPSTGATGYYTWGIKHDTDLAMINTPAVYAHPFNENKQNYIYTRFRFDLTSGYQDLWVYDDHYDLTGLGAGSGIESTTTNFNNGLNFYVAINNRGSSHAAQAWVDLDRCRAWYE